jgi:hypothetical protein
LPLSCKECAANKQKCGFMLNILLIDISQKKLNKQN